MSSHAEETPNVADRGGVAGPSALVLAEAGRGGLQPEAGHEPLPWRSPNPNPEPNPERVGEHAAHWASEFGPAYTFQPTELDADALDSIRLYAQGLANVAPPLLLDTAAEAERRGSPHLNPSPSLKPLT